MNPFSLLSQSLLNSKLQGNSQSSNNSKPNPNLPNQGLHIPTPYNLQLLANSQLQQANSNRRVPPLDEFYNPVTKRVRHSQDNFSEISHEQSTSLSQQRLRLALEDQARFNLATQSLGQENLIPGLNIPKMHSHLQHPSLEGNQGSFPSPREQALLGLIKQQQQQQQSNNMRELYNREMSMNRLMMPSIQNEGMQSMLAENFNLPSVFSGQLSLNNPLSLEYIKQLENQQKANNQLNQYLQYQQQYAKLQDYLRNQTNLASNQGEVKENSPLQIPFLSPMPFSTQSQTNSANVITLIRPENKELNQMNFGNQIASRKLGVASQGPDKGEGGSRSNFESIKMRINDDGENRRIGDGSTMEQLEEQKRSDLDGDRWKAGSLMEMESASKEALKKSKVRAPMEERVLDQIAKKDGGLRRKNKWQVLAEKNEGDEIEGAAMMGEEGEAGGGGNLEGKKEQGKGSLSREQKRARDKENRNMLLLEDQYFEPRPSEPKASVSSSQGKERNAHRSSGKGRNTGHSNRDMEAGYSEGPNIMRKSSLTMGEGYMHSYFDADHPSIMSSYGRAASEYVADSETQRIVNTKIGEEHQVRVADIDLNSNQTPIVRRVPKQMWSPEILSEEVLHAYFQRLQGLMSCTGISEEKAITMLAKKGMIPEQVIVTVKKNEKFYSTFLGAYLYGKEVRARKGSEASR